MSTRVLFALCALAGCARSSDPQLYTLGASAGTRSWDTATVIELRRPHVAGYLDRREIVRRVLAQRLELDRQAIWAEPLDSLLAGALVEDLGLRLPNSQVASELSQVRATPSTIIQLDLQRFEQGKDEVVLRALVSVHGGTEPSELMQVELHSPLARADTAALVSTMAALVGQLSDRIAAGVHARARVSPGPAAPSMAR